MHNYEIKKLRQEILPDYFKIYKKKNKSIYVEQLPMQL